MKGNRQKVIAITAQLSFLGYSVGYKLIVDECNGTDGIQLSDAVFVMNNKTKRRRERVLV